MSGPSMHPVDVANRVIDSGIAESPHNRVTDELTVVEDDVAVVESFSHCWAVDAGEGLVCWDASGVQSGPAVVEALRGWTDLPVDRLVYTHGHVDHVGGSGAFMADAERRGDRRPTFVAHEGVPARFERYRATNGWNRAINRRQFGGIRNRERLGIGGDEHRFLADDVVEPDELVGDRGSFTVGDRTFELRHARGETDDHVWGWDAERKTAWTGDFVCWMFPNAGNPQKVQRYPIEWAAAMRDMLAVGVERVYPAHGLPIVGRTRCETVLGEVAEALEHLAGQTLELMNGGATIDEIIHEVRVPDHLADRPWLAPQYDEPEFVVRNVYRQFGGWWDGNPANLKPAPEAALATEMVRLVGSVEALVERALELVDEGDLRLACHLVQTAVAAEPEHEGAQRARAHVYWYRRAAERSLMSKGVFAAAARESEAVLGEAVSGDSFRSTVKDAF